MSEASWKISLRARAAKAARKRQLKDRTAERTSDGAATVRRGSETAPSRPPVSARAAPAEPALRPYPEPPHDDEDDDPALSGDGPVTHVRGAPEPPQAEPRVLSLRERLTAELLDVMDQKHHPAWFHLTRPGLTRAQLLVHFRHEYLTYVRDFPILLARILGQGPPAYARAALAENIYEEQTGKLSFGVPHPELFLEMMEGLGLDRNALESATPPLVPAASLYRGLLDRVSSEAPWVVGAAVLAIFVEGSLHERAEVEGRIARPPIDEVVASHPMVAHYGCPPERMRLVRAHRAVEGGHRADAWRLVLEGAGEDEQLAGKVAGAVREARAAWYAYREGVARAMGVSSAL